MFFTNFMRLYSRIVPKTCQDNNFVGLIFLSDQIVRTYLRFYKLSSESAATGTGTSSGVGAPQGCSIGVAGAHRPPAKLKLSIRGDILRM